MRLATVQCSTYKEWHNMELRRHAASFLLRNFKASDAAIRKIIVINSGCATQLANHFCNVCIQVYNIKYSLRVDTVQDQMMK